MKVTIYGRLVGCNFCKTAKQVCETNNIEYTFHDMESENITKEDLATITGVPVSTVPQILVDDQYVGGCNEFIKYLRDM